MTNTDNSEFIKEFSTAAAKAGHAKTLADAIGMPDDVDKEFLQKLVLRFEKKHPGIIKHLRDSARAEQQMEAKNRKFLVGADKANALSKYGVANTEAAGRVTFEIPAELFRDIERHYPTMFTERKHYNWFVKHFKELLVPESY